MSSPDADLDPGVADALNRVCELVAGAAGAWVVGGVSVPPGAPALADELYARWYTQPDASPPRVAGDALLLRASLLEALRAAHASAATLVPGWTATASDPRGVVSAVSGGAARVLRPGEYVMPRRPGVPPAPGEQVEPVARLDLLDAARGLWWTFSERAPEPPIGRIYFDVRPATAPRAVHEITSALANVAFQLKCPILPVACERVDAMVLYHPRDDRDHVLSALSRRWAVLGPLLDPAVPPLTCVVAPGLAWADDLDDGRSYGESRCHLLASAITASPAAWATGEGAERRGILVAALLEAGVDPRRPWASAA